MGTLDIEQAARVCGLSAREVRLLIEGGQLPATRPSGRWLVDEAELSATGLAKGEAPGAESRAPFQGSLRPVGAVPSDPDPAAAEGLGPVLARLEQAAVQIADLRAERDDLRLELREQVASLRRSLEQSIEELDAARARVAELEAGRFERSVKDANSDARAALTPLFRAMAPEDS